MSLPVVLSPRADLQLDEITGWWGENRSAEQAERWLAGIVAAIKSLPESPLRYALAGENDLFPFEIREMHFGLGSRPTHRVLFTLRPDCIYVHLIRHLMQGELSRDDL